MSEKIVTFESVHMTLKAEKAMRLAGLKTEAINTPRRLSSDCGISLKFDATREEQIKEVLINTKIGYKGIYDYD